MRLLRTLDGGTPSVRRPRSYDRPRAMESDIEGVAFERTPSDDQGFSGGAGKNRTCDLSIISSPQPEFCEFT